MLHIHIRRERRKHYFCIFHFWGVLRSSLPAWFARWHSGELPASTTGEIPTSAVLLPSSPTKRRKIRKVLLAGTTGELPTSMILQPSSPKRKKKNKVGTPRWYNERTPSFRGSGLLPYRKEKNKVRTSRWNKRRTPGYPILACPSLYLGAE
jgi:hypothetical protein